MDYSKKMVWFNEARFGMFVHFGLYSLFEHGEWVMYEERIPAMEYAKLADRFKPAEFNAEALADQAVQAGAKYMVFTTRHHDGFCLYDSKVSDFTSVKTAAQRDFVAEYLEAARKAGLRVGLYYSLLDWRFPGYFEPEKHPESSQAMVAQAHAQVRELMSNYGKIDILFYDGGWTAKADLNKERMVEFWHSEKLNSMVRELQPEIIINDRSGTPEDIDTPEQRVAASQSGRGWESCMTIGDFVSWGYIRHNPNYKTVPQLLQHLINAAQGEGNFLLNAGLTPEGRICNEESERLNAIGQWLRWNGEAIYGSQRCELIGHAATGQVDINLHGPWIRKGNIGYWHLFRWPGREAVQILVDTPARKVTLLATGQEFPFEYDVVSGKLRIYNLPFTPPDAAVNVLKVEFVAEPKRKIENNLAAWLK
jgi:alpha-L-fucosidase